MKASFSVGGETRINESLTDRDRAYLDILHHGLVLLRSFSHGGQLVFCPAETEHLHEMPRLIGMPDDYQHAYYLRATRNLYLQKLRELADTVYLEQVSIWYSEPWHVLAEAAGIQLAGWDGEVEA